jgi:tetratricopeptide (TPR) repeat protein
MTDAKELERQLEAAYAAIHELDEDLAAGRISATDHADLKARSERQAAGLLAKLQGARPAARAERSVPDARPTRAGLWSPITMAVVAVGLVGFGVGVGVLATRFAADEPATATAAPAMSPAGAPGMPPGDAAAAPARPPASPALLALAEKAEKDDASVTTMLEFARKALDEGHMSPAIATYKRVLDRDPKNPEALTRIGGILFQANHVDQALARIDQAIAADAKFAPAHYVRAHVLFTGRQDAKGAVASLEKYLALAPKGAEADAARAMLADAKKQLASAPAKP